MEDSWFSDLACTVINENVDSIQSNGCTESYSPYEDGEYFRDFCEKGQR